jgi:DNA repair exonuclease SbcCD ATPase subunit
METTLTEQRKAAVDLDQRIKTTVKTFTEDFIQLCRLLDEMCSKKLYKEFGYQTFYDYCDKEIGLKPTQSKKWAKIGEGFKENGQSTVHFGNLGTEKLYLLAKLDEPERETVQQAVNVEDVSVKELKAEIDKLKAANKKAESNLKSLQTELDNEKKSNEELMSLRFEKESAEMQLKRTKKELASANERITDLENRPVEVAVQEDEEGKKAKVLVKELEQQLSETKSSHANALETQKQQYQSQINDLEEQLEQAKNKPAETIMVSSDKETFKAYYLPAVNAFENMLKFISGCSEKDFCIEKTKNLLEICRKKLGEI